MLRCYQTCHQKLKIDKEIEDLSWKTSKESLMLLEQLNQMSQVVEALGYVEKRKTEAGRVSGANAGLLSKDSFSQIAKSVSNF